MAQSPTPQPTGKRLRRSTERERLRFLEKYFSSARAELMWRVKHRDHWLTFQVGSQIALFAIGSGQLKLEQLAPSSSPVPSLVILAGPIGLVFASLYFVEDRLVGLLSNYASAVSFAEWKLNGEQMTLLAWDKSEQHARYYRPTLWVRYAVQVVCFVALPALIFCTVYPQPWGRFPAAVAGSTAVGTFALLAWSLVARSSDFRASRVASILRQESPDDLRDIDLLR